MEDPNKLHRVVDARMKLKARFEEKIRQTPSVADGRPMGTGNPNRHGMPVVPVGQEVTVKWPVLDLGVEPDISLTKNKPGFWEERGYSNTAYPWRNDRYSR